MRKVKHAIEMSNQMKEMYTILTCKEVSNILGVSLSNGQKIVRDIKEECKVKYITLYHVSKYLRIEIDDLKK